MRIINKKKNLTDSDNLNCIEKHGPCSFKVQEIVSTWVMVCPVSLTTLIKDTEHTITEIVAIETV